MRLKKLTLKNIRSYEFQEIDFPDGSLLLSGDIGSGKTTILLAIEYALFGLQPGQRGSALLRNNSETGEVSLNLEIKGKDILIERKIKRGTKSVSNDYAAITIDNKKFESSITEVKTKILKLLGYPQEFLKKNNILYKYTVYTPQEQTKQIILEDPEIRLNVLRHVFGIDKYKRIRESLSIIASKLKEDLKYIELEVKEIDNEKEELKSLYDSLKNIEKTLEKKHHEFGLQNALTKNSENEVRVLEEKIREKVTLGSEVEKTKIMIASKKEAFSSLEKEISEISYSISESKERFDAGKYEELIMIIELKKEILKKFNTEFINSFSKIKSLEQYINELIDKKDKIFKIDICPTCLQDVSENHKHNILNATEEKTVEMKKEISALKIEIQKLSDLIKNEEEQAKKLDEEKSRLLESKLRTEYLDESRERLKNITKKKELLEKDIILLLKHIDSVKEDILASSKFDNLYKSKKEELKSCLETERKTEISIAELNKESELIRKQSVNLEKSISKKEESKKRYNYLTDLNNWLSNKFLNLINFIEKSIMMKLRKEFSRLFSKWFSVLVSDESFQIQLDENFTPIVLQNGVEMEYFYLSGGERTAIALAYRLALNQTINSVITSIRTKEIMILDEPTEGLSEAQIEKIREILQELKIPQLIIVSHENKIEGFVDHVFKIKKENDSSLITPEGPYMPKSEETLKNSNSQ